MNRLFEKGTYTDELFAMSQNKSGGTEDGDKFIPHPKKSEKFFLSSRKWNILAFRGLTTSLRRTGRTSVDDVTGRDVCH
ncbi:hypothetical protein JOC34_002066 [Virgibacillus halotolerans]|nr:hypothetical protein [Virgibacillus halotolerans]